MQGDLDSFLIEITSLILPKKDDKGDGFLVDKIQDKTGMKGTGAAWCGTEVRLSRRRPGRTADHPDKSHTKRLSSVRCCVPQASGQCSRRPSCRWRRPPLRLRWTAASCRA